MKRMSKRDPKVEERIGVAAIAKVERARLLGGLERPKLRGARWCYEVLGGATRAEARSFLGIAAVSERFSATRSRIQTALCRHARPLSFSLDGTPLDPLSSMQPQNFLTLFLSLPYLLLFSLGRANHITTKSCFPFWRLIDTRIIRAKNFLSRSFHYASLHSKVHTYRARRHYQLYSSLIESVFYSYFSLAAKVLCNDRWQKVNPIIPLYLVPSTIKIIVRKYHFSFDATRKSRKKAT